MATNNLSDLRSQAGQLLIFGFDGLAVESGVATALSKMQPGGVILFARNIEEPVQTWKLLRDCQAGVPVPLFLCVDLEGGTVDRLKRIIAPAPSVQDVFATGQRRLFRMHGNILGLETRGLGFNTDFAPVLDLRLEASRAVLTSRTASADPRATILYAREFLRGLETAEALGCGKHFPGLGEAPLDSHNEMPLVRKSWTKMWTEDLLPYRELHRQLPFVMIAHASYPDVTKDDLPASLSRKWIDEILRHKIGYRGLIVSDDLEMGGVASAGPIEEVAVETLRAGADMFLVCNKLELAWRAYEAVVRAAEGDPKLAEQIRQAAQRVADFKRRSRALHKFAGEPKAQVVQKLKRIVEQFSRVVAAHGLPRTDAGHA